MINQEYLKSILIYNPSSGSFSWKVSRNRKIKIGQIAGAEEVRGYWVISIDRKIYKAHRLAFLYMTGEIPEYVDHVDGDKLNNSWDNLREATRSNNSRNRRAGTNNTSGVKGVSFHKVTGKWRAQLVIDGKVTHLGTFKDKDAARDVVISAREEYHGEFANHG